MGTLHREFTHRPIFKFLHKRLLTTPLLNFTVNTMNHRYNKILTSLALTVPISLLGVAAEANEVKEDSLRQRYSTTVDLINQLQSAADVSDAEVWNGISDESIVSVHTDTEAVALFSEGLMDGFSDRVRQPLETVLPGDLNLATSQYSAEMPTAQRYTETLNWDGISTIDDATVAQNPTSDTFSPLSDQEIREQLLTTPNTTEAPEIDVLDRRPQPVPSSTFITPNAYGADWGDFYVGSAGATERTNGGTDGNDGIDGSIAAGMGFGNAARNVGVELNVGVINIDNFAADGTVGFKVHRVFPEANNLGVAVGWSNAVKWGDARRDEDTIYGVVTQRFDLRPNRDNSMPLTTSLGVGTGAFRSTGAIEAGDNAPNVFGSVGLRVIPQVSLVSSWSGSALGLAASAAPFNFPVVLTAGVSDLTGNTEEGAQFVGGLGYSFGF